MIISGGTIVSSLLSDKLTRKLGTHKVIVISVFLTAAALLGFSISGQFWMLVLFAIPYGLGAGAIDAALNNYVALYYSSKHMSWLHSFWGVGTIISPFVMGHALINSTWNSGYRTVSFMQIGIALLLLVSFPIWKTNGKNAQDDSTSIGLFDALKIKDVPYLLIGFFAYASAESTVMAWASTYLVEVKNITVAHFYLVFFILGLITICQEG